MLQESVIYSSTAFALAKEYPSIQLSVHLSNLCATYSTNEALIALRHLLNDPSQLVPAAKVRRSFPVLFRAGQLIEAYGAEMVSLYLKDVYGLQESSAHKNETHSQKVVEIV